MMLRNLLVFLLISVVLLVAVVFAAGNPGTIVVDLAGSSFEIQKSLAFVIAVGVGWLFGVLCVGGMFLGFLYERRKLRRALRLAEAEVRSLRSLPMQDAD